MKLYTEKQVRQIASTIYSGHFDCNDTPDDLVDELTPIELPTDEEIEKELLEHTKVSTIDPYKSFYFNAAMYGAKWVIEKIKQQGK